MPIEWPTVVTSGGVMAAIAYVLQKTVEHALKRSEARLVDRLELDSKKATLIFEKQIPIYRALLGLAYRSRNTVRELAAGVADREQGRSLLQRLQGSHDSLVKLLYEERALLPESVFAPAHALKHASLRVDPMVDVFKFRGEPIDPTQLTEQAGELLKEVGSLYDSLETVIQTKLGTLEGGA